MADQKNEHQGYLPLLAASAPAFAAKGIIGDMSRASVEHGVESRVMGSRLGFGRLLAQGARGRGVGRALGGLLGVATAPVYMHGTQLLQSKDRKERLKGYGSIAGATLGYAGAKGFLENFAKARATGANPGIAAGKGMLLASIRGGYKLPLALATAYSVAAGRKRDKDKGGGSAKYLLPVAVGAGAGALSRTVEEGAEMAMSRERASMAARTKRLMAAGAGGAAGGVIGGLVLAAAVDATSKLLNRGKEKKAFLLTGATLGLAAKGAFAAKGILASKGLLGASAAGLAKGTAAKATLGAHGTFGAGLGGVKALTLAGVPAAAAPSTSATIAHGMATIGSQLAQNAAITKGVIAAHPVAAGVVGLSTANSLLKQHNEQILSAAGKKAAEAAHEKTAEPFTVAALLAAKGIPILANGLSLSNAAAAGVAAKGLGAAALGKMTLSNAGHVGAAVGKGFASNVGHAMAVGIPLHAATGAAFGYKNGLAGMIRGALPEEAVSAMERTANTARARHFSYGLREGLMGKAQPSMLARTISNMTVPELSAQRQLGTSLGRKLRDHAPEDRERILRGLQQLMVERPGMLKGTSGEANPLLAPILGGISMSLGDRAHYAGNGPATRAWQKLVLEKELRAPGLPTRLGELKKEPGYWGRNGLHLAEGATAVGMTAAGVMPHGPASYLLGHTAWGGVKNGVVDLPAMHAKINRDTHGGLKYGLFPNAYATKGDKRLTNLLDLVVSPATSMSERSIKPIARTLRDEKMTQAFQHMRESLGHASDRVMRPKHPHASKILLPAVAGGLAGAALLAGSQRRK